MFDRNSHWQGVYERNQVDEVSWYQAVPDVSLKLINSTGVAKTSAVIDVGAGASLLVDHLLDQGYDDLSILDISGQALHHCKNRLGEQATRVRWIESDVLEFKSNKTHAIWHDRAVFHFMTQPDDQQRYLTTLGAALHRGGFCLDFDVFR